MDYKPPDFRSSLRNRDRQSMEGFFSLSSIAARRKAFNDNRNAKYYSSGKQRSQSSSRAVESSSKSEMKKDNKVKKLKKKAVKTSQTPPPATSIKKRKLAKKNLQAPPLASKLKKRKLAKTNSQAPLASKKRKLKKNSDIGKFENLGKRLDDILNSNPDPKARNELIVQALEKDLNEEINLDLEDYFDQRQSERLNLLHPEQNEYLDSLVDAELPDQFIRDDILSHDGDDMDLMGRDFQAVTRKVSDCFFLLNKLILKVEEFLRRHPGIKIPKKLEVPRLRILAERFPESGDADALEQDVLIIRDLKWYLDSLKIDSRQMDKIVTKYIENAEDQFEKSNEEEIIQEEDISNHSLDEEIVDKPNIEDIITDDKSNQEDVSKNSLDENEENVITEDVLHQEEDVSTEDHFSSYMKLLDDPVHGPGMKHMKSEEESDTILK